MNNRVPNSRAGPGESPRLVIGFPVYNGERYLREAVDSILGQSFSDFRLLVSDNASTDSTEELCRAYASEDSRVVYRRQPTNIGAGPNFNAAFDPGTSPYFKWAAHDDVLERTYLQRCVDLLDGDSTLAIAHSRSAEINEHSTQVGTYDYELRVGGKTPSRRFQRLLWTGYFTEVFGVMRSELVQRTKLMGSYAGADRNFLAEMVLQGDVAYVEDHLFLRRNHPETYCGKLSSDADRVAWFDPSKRIPSSLAGPVKLKEYVSSLSRLSLPSEEIARCGWYLAEWAGRRTYERCTGDGDRYRKRLAARQATERQQKQGDR